MAQLFGYRNMPNSYIYHASWFRLIRPPTLTGSIMAVIAGTMLASQYVEVNVFLFIVLIITSVLIQAAVNMLNDYFDYMKGQEEGKWHISVPTTCHQGPKYAHVPYVSLSLIALVSVLTLWLAQASSFWIIPLGIIGLVIGYCYSAGRRSLSSLGLGEIAAAISLGPLPLMIAVLVQGAPVTAETMLLAIPFALLMASLILTNNIRDIKKDSTTRRTVPIRIGRKIAKRLLVVILTATYMSSLLIFQSILVIASLPVAIALVRHFYAHDRFNPMNLAAFHHGAHSLILILMIIFQ
ncbi:prenyltransferase [Salicibibacter cibarius]|uniref:Prenyltransferase n=1 Tax=Salicibibacter cibarius TaxID=2743000 RepID=A0A7T6Z4D1_9BACI|nr:prenyltransferase [Salicibibacter cibarius]QQK76704.1 prenyltransferase [Salicibibacter cibarius]